MYPRIVHWMRWRFCFHCNPNNHTLLTWLINSLWPNVFKIVSQVLCSYGHSFFYLWYTTGLEQTMLLMINSHLLPKMSSQVPPLHPLYTLLPHQHLHMTSCYKAAKHYKYLISSCHLYRLYLSNRIHLEMLTRPTMNNTCLLNWKTAWLLTTRVTPSKAALFWTWLVWIRWMEFPQPCPLQLMWTAWPHIVTCSQQPHLLTSPLASSLQFSFMQ